MKKVFMAFAVVAMMAGVSACGNSNSNKTGDENPAPAVTNTEDNKSDKKEGCTDEKNCDEKTPAETSAETTPETTAE